MQMYLEGGSHGSMDNDRSCGQSTESKASKDLTGSDSKYLQTDEQVTRMRRDKEPRQTR